MRSVSPYRAAAEIEHDPAPAPPDDDYDVFEPVALPPRRRSWVDAIETSRPAMAFTMTLLGMLCALGIITLLFDLRHF